MTNYSEMKAADLKLMARDAGVKNWWNLNKASLVEALTATFAEDEVLPVESITVNFATGEVTLKMICDCVNVTPRRARKLLRRVYGANNVRWTFKADEVESIKKIIAA